MTPEDATLALELVQMHKHKLPTTVDTEPCVYVLFVLRGNALPSSSELWRVKLSEADKAFDTRLHSVAYMLRMCTQCADGQKIMGVVFPTGETSFEVMSPSKS